MERRMRCRNRAGSVLLTLVLMLGILQGGNGDFIGPIKTLVVLVMENRSFDHMLGWMKKLNPQIDGVTGKESNPVSTTNPNAGTVIFSNQAEYVDPDPGHSFAAIREQVFGSNDASANPAPMNGFAQQANEQGGPSMTQAVMSGFRPEAVPVYTSLVSQFAVFDRWFAAVPASTQPNRLYVHSATSHGATSNIATRLAEGYPQKTIFDSIYESGLDFGIYYQNVPATLFYKNLRKLKFWSKFHSYDSKFKSDVEQGNLPNYVVVEQRYTDLSLAPANDDHPSHDVAEGQKLIKEVYETLRSSPQWNETLFVITYDEHGGFFDHVPTPVTGVPSPDDIAGPPPDNFAFDRLGVRVPTIMVSPWIEKGTVIHGATGPQPTSQYEHSSIPATAKKLFGLQSDFLTRRDAWAGTFEGVLNRQTPRTDCPETLPDPPKIRPGEANEEASLSQFQQELVQLAASLKGDDLLLAYPNSIGKNMTVAQGTAYIKNSVKAFFEAGRQAKALGASDDKIVNMRPSLTTRSATSSLP